MITVAYKKILLENSNINKFNLFLIIQYYGSWATKPAKFIDAW